MSYLAYTPFSDISLENEFFDSLRDDYDGFDAWFKRKATESAYVLQDGDSILGFLYLKVEDGPVTDVMPPLPERKYLKMGTLKVVPHGTRLGERLIKKALDNAVTAGADAAYVTVFPKHAALTTLLEKYGFKLQASKGDELVLVKDLRSTEGDLLSRYPIVVPQDDRVFMLAIYPEYHTRLFPDSKLITEGPDIIQDVSHTNSIHKVYLTAMRGVEGLQRGDTLLIYRTSDGLGPAHYRSVVTSICVVEEARSISSFSSEAEFIRYASPYSVFTDSELKEFWRHKRYPTIVRFTYNIALKKRITRKQMLDAGLIDSEEYAGFVSLDSAALVYVIEAGEVDANLVVALA